MYSLDYWVLGVRLVLVNNWPEILCWVVGSLIVAWLFSRKGYEYWRFFLVALLAGPLLSLAFYLLLPVLFPPDGKARAKAKPGRSNSFWDAPGAPKQ